MDVEVIRNLPLCNRIQDDFWAWNFERIGIFCQILLPCTGRYEANSGGLVRCEAGILEFG